MDCLTIIEKINPNISTEISSVYSKTLLIKDESFVISPNIFQKALITENDSTKISTSTLILENLLNLVVQTYYDSGHSTIKMMKKVDEELSTNKEKAKGRPKKKKLKKHLLMVSKF